MTAARRLRHGPQRGAALIEFALVLPLLLTIAVGIVYYGYAFVLKAATESAAQNGAQEAVALSPLSDDYDPGARAQKVALDSLDWLPEGVREAAGVAQASECDASGLFGVRVRIDLSGRANTVLPQLELGGFKIPPRPPVIESYACASL